MTSAEGSSVGTTSAEGKSSYVGNADGTLSGRTSIFAIWSNGWMAIYTGMIASISAKNTRMHNGAERSEKKILRIVNGGRPSTVTNGWTDCQLKTANGLSGVCRSLDENGYETGAGSSNLLDAQDPFAKGIGTEMEIDGAEWKRAAVWNQDPDTEKPAVPSNLPGAVAAGNTVTELPAGGAGLSGDHAVHET